MPGTMLLKLVDRLVREENYAEALRILARASEEDPRNPYVRAYEARIRGLMDHPHSPASELSESGRVGIHPPSGTPHPSSPLAMSPEQRRAALLSKVAALLSKANEYLNTGDFQHAIEEVSRARLLDQENPDIRVLELRIREAREEADRFAENERTRLAREQDEAHRREMEELRREEEERRKQQEQARRAAQQQKLQESLARCRALLSSGRLKEAQNELAFALVLDPSSQAARQLDQEVSRAHEQAVRAEAERKQREQEERARAEQELRQKIQAAADQAREEAARGAYAEALSVITRAYVLDPASTLLQDAESDITAAREEAIRQAREEEAARKRDEEERRIEEQRRKAEEERQALLHQRELEAEARKQTSEKEIEQHLERARTFQGRGHFEAALAEVALAFVIDPFNERTRLLEQDILHARESAPEPQEVVEEAAPRMDEQLPAAIAVHLDNAREQAATHDFAKAFDSIARAYAVDPLHPAVQECERVIQASFVEYQGSLALSPGGQAAPGSRLSQIGREGFAGGTQDDSDGMSLLAFHASSTTESSSLPDGDEASSASKVPYAWQRHRSLMYGGGIGVLVLAGVVFLVSSPSGERPEMSKFTLPERVPAEQVETREPPSAPVTLSEPQILPGDLADEIQAPADRAPAEPRRKTQETPAEEPARQDKKPRIEETTAEPVIEEPANEPPVSLSKLDVTSPTLAQPSPSTPAPQPTVMTKAPEIKRLQQPRIPDAILNSGVTGEVAVLVEIDPTGQPVSARIARSTIPVLNDLFIDAVMGSEFTPGVSQDGQTTTYLTIPFRVGG